MFIGIDGIVYVFYVVSVTGMSSYTPKLETTLAEFMYIKVLIPPRETGNTLNSL